MKANRKCVVCGSEYYYKSCNCEKDKDQTWRNIYDTKECNSLFDVLSAYVNGSLSKGDAKIKLKGFALPNKVKEKYQKLVDEIMAEPARRTRQAKKKQEEEAIEEEIVNSDLDEE